ncbi:MAG: AraC family transcriptional regulator [Rhodocyclales bacterium]|nr:AraC family transcriptional regulator [Rhodocyclales bacterium]
MKPTPVTIPILLVQRMLSGWGARGRDCTRPLDEAGIAPALLAHRGACVSADQYVTLFRVLIERLDDEALGLLSRPLKCGSFALCVRAAASASTLEDAIRRAAHTFRLLQDDLCIGRTREVGLACIELRFSNAAAAANPFTHELFLRVFWRLFAWLIGGRLPIARFDFAYAADVSSDFHRMVFPAPHRYAQPRTALWFDAALLQSHVQRDEQAVLGFLARTYQEVIIPERSADVSGKVRHHLQRSQPAWPDLARTAEALHMAASTLQRHLLDEGTSFQTLKNQLRRDLAVYRLQTSDIPLAKLAGELGFADTAAFQRAFKSWTGSPPGAYRNHARNPG